jgi:radical SAM superfamily enzyme YgiQ (UPF0313 family)
MKVTLISIYGSILANGLRIISSYLKKHGHEVDMIFLNITDFKPSGTFSQEVLDGLIYLCKSSDLIGFSLMTYHFIKVKELTIKLKDQLEIPVIWGGVHPTVKPEECLKYADMICIGEGEEAMLELVNKLKSGNITSVKNIWLKKNRKIIRNEIRDLEENLDKYPFQDYDIRTHYILKGNKIVKMTEPLLTNAMPKNAEMGKPDVGYHLNTTRNCPHNCTYCCNNAYRKIYHKKGKFVRKRSPENVVREIELVKNKFEFIKQVAITDDTFFIRNMEDIKEFSHYYKERINLPLRCNVSPHTLTEEKLNFLIDAGLFRVSMGVQSYCIQTLKNVYKRPTPKNVIWECVQLIDKYKSKLPRPVYHIIVDNPYETKKSMKETIEFAASLPQGARIMLFPLVFYPGTELYERAMKDGIIKDEIKDIYLKDWNLYDIKKRDYLTYILYFWAGLRKKGYNKYPLVTRIIKFMSRDAMIVLFDNKFSLSLLKAALKIMRLVNRKIISKFTRSGI